MPASASRRLPLVRALGADPARATLVLRHAVCAACAFGSRGLWDEPGRSLHRCRDRRAALPDAVRGPMDRRALPDPRAPGRGDPRLLGRVPAPLLRRPGEPFRVLGWDDALHLLRTRAEAAGPAGVALQVGPEPQSVEFWWVARRLVERGFRLSIADPPVDRPLFAALAAQPDRPVRPLAELESAGALLDALPPEGPSPLRRFRRRAARRGALVRERTGRADAVLVSAAAADRLPALLDAAGPEAAVCPVFVHPGSPGRFFCAPAPAPSERPPEVAVVCGGPPPPHLLDAALRVHVLPFLDAAACAEPSGELLVLPASTWWDAAGGTLRPGTDGRVRFTPEILGLPDFEARPAWWVLDRLAPGPEGPLEDADALRGALARRPGWEEAARCNAPRAVFLPGR